jgi:hypothetical protein
MKWSTVGLRRVSDVPGLIPWKSPLVGLIRVRAAGDACEIAHARTVGEKRSMVAGLLPSDCVVVAWPGQHSQDMFLLDDSDELRATLSAPPTKKSTARR